MKIEKIKKSGKKYKILLSDGSEIKTYDDVILKYNLLYNKTIDNDLLNKINSDNNYYEIYYKTINYITKRLRSEKEINEYIDKNKVTNKDKEQLIKKLKELNLINDLNFTKAYIADKINLSNEGIDKIKNNLLKHDIASEVIDNELAKIDNDLIKEKLKKLIIKKTKNAKYTGYKLKYKVINELINLGYDKTDISEIYDSLNLDNNYDLKQEYDKLYKKLSIKYQGQELKRKIRNKLYNKGFSIEEINSIIEDY